MTDTESATPLRVGFVDNMGGLAGALAERQFDALLGAAAGRPLQRLRIATRPSVAGRLVGSPADVASLPPLDLLVFSGAEPTGALPEAPFWPGLTALLDDAEARARPVVLSCLAAHAALLHHDGLARSRLPVKRSGVYRFPINRDHPLLRGAECPAEAVAVAHSRGNELPPALLTAAGYTLLTGDGQTGFDMATADDRPWLLLQGHPEYGPQTLIDEYRRDIGRFLRGGCGEYPRPPAGGLDAESATRFAAFEQTALAADPPTREALLAAVPHGRSNGAIQPADRMIVRQLLGAWLTAALGGAPLAVRPAEAALG